MKYIPSPVHAWESLQFLNNEVVWGGFVRALHYFGASAMVVLVFVHMARVFITGSYKFPRELNWITGVVLLFLILAMAFTGQLLRWDHHGVATVEVAATMLGRFPLMGGWLMDLVLAGQTVGGATLSRFFALHVIVFPLLIVGLIGCTCTWWCRNGCRSPRRPGRPVDPATYRSWYARHKEEGAPASFRTWCGRSSSSCSWSTPSSSASPSSTGRRARGAPGSHPHEQVPRPDWYFLWYYALIWYKPPALDALVLVWFPLLVFPLLMLLPLLFPKGRASAVAAALGGGSPWEPPSCSGRPSRLRPPRPLDSGLRHRTRARRHAGRAPRRSSDGAASFTSGAASTATRPMDRGGTTAPT
jgi:ubiquinol-cytochrome c reductase cytochrome b subunit